MTSRPVVYCVVGLPRTGSTFLGDWVARRVAGVNVGESWQTFRTLGEVTDPNASRRGGRWFREADKKRKIGEIRASLFWERVLSQNDAEPYAALLQSVAEYSDVVVDCSKSTKALEQYVTQGCHVRVLHTVRPFSAWCKAMRKYQLSNDVPRASRFRLLLAYIRLNRKFRGLSRSFPYRKVFLNSLSELDQLEWVSGLNVSRSGKYVRFEMFGTPNFSATLNEKRLSEAVTRIDRLVFKLAGA